MLLVGVPCTLISRNASGPSGVRFVHHMRKVWRLKVVAQNNISPVCTVHFHSMSLPEPHMYKSVAFKACHPKTSLAWAAYIISSRGAQIEK